MRTALLSTLLLSLLCYAFAQTTPCGDGHGILVGTDCLCESGFKFDGSTCTAETTACPINLPDDLNSPVPISLGAGVTADSFVLNINVPMEKTRILTSVTFDAIDTSSSDYPADFSDYVRTVTESSCSDTFTISIATTDLPSTITYTPAPDGSSVEYSGTIFVTSIETLSDNSTRTISQQLPFDYTFPVVTASISNIDVISSIGTVLKSNILQQAASGNVIQLVIQLSTPFPYQLDFVDQAPITGTKFAGTDVVLPTESPDSPALTYTLQPVTGCASTAQGALCVQTATVNIDYSTGCSVDGSYTLNFAVTGCNTAGGVTPSIDCLQTNANTIENIPVVVTVSSLQMGNLCVDQKTFNARASDLIVYADSTFTTQKSEFIANDAAQSLMYFATILSIGPDATSVNAYKSFEITGVTKMCAGVSSCTGHDDPFPEGDVTNLSPNNTFVQFSVPIADFTELTDDFSDIPYSITVSLALTFSDNSKRAAVFERTVSQNLNTRASGTVQFVSGGTSQSQNNNNNNNNNNNPQASSGARASFSTVLAATLVVVVVALVTYI